MNIRPFGIENDETGGFIEHLLGKMHGKMIFNVGNYGIQFHITNFFVALFGINRISMKLVGVVAGILTIPAVYFMIRKVINARTAVFVTTIFAFLRWDVHYSRSGHATAILLLVEALALYFLARSIEKRDKSSYFLCGLTMGLGWHGVLTAWFISIIPFIYWGIKSLAEKGFFRKNIIGFTAFILGLWIFGSMMLHNYFLSTDIYFTRLHEVSVFSKDNNAPENIGSGIIDNAEKVLLMFNYRGDQRERNSGGMPFDPTVDFVSGMFFALGFFYAVYYSRYWLFFILLIIFFSQAAGSIFSIEAPNAMRTFGMLIPVLVFIGVIFDRLYTAFKSVLGPKLEKVFYPLLLVILLFFIMKDNYNEVFNRWITGLDELPTAAGLYSEKLGKTYRIFLDTSLYYPEHPPYRFYRWDYKVNGSDNALDGLEDLNAINDENFAVLLNSDTWKTLPFWLKKFPAARHEIIDHAYFNKKVKEGGGLGKFFDSVLVGNNEIKAMKGLKAEYYYAGGTKETAENDLPEFSPEKANKIPYRAVWTGSVMFPYYCTGYMINRGSVPVRIAIDGHPVKTGISMRYKFARGSHKIRIEAQRRLESDTLRLYMEIEKMPGSKIEGAGVADMGKNTLYNFSVEGLHGYYYDMTGMWDKKSLVDEEINPCLWFNVRGTDDLPAIKWQGTISIDKSGLYSIYASRRGYVRIEIDNQQYWDGGLTADNKKQIDEYFKNSMAKKTERFYLNRGKHKIQVYSYRNGLVNLLWDAGEADKSDSFLPPDILEPDYQITDYK